MKVNLTGEAPLRSETINLGEAGEFHVHVKPPTYEELIADSSKVTNYIEDRVKTCIVGWTGLVEEVAIEGEEPKEQEIPFTWENFKKLCSQFPAFYRRCTQIANECYSGASSKNVMNASGIFSADAVLKQLGLQPGLPSGVSGGSPSQQASPLKPS